MFFHVEKKACQIRKGSLVTTCLHAATGALPNVEFLNVAAFDAADVTGQKQ